MLWKTNQVFSACLQPFKSCSRFCYTTNAIWFLSMVPKISACLTSAEIESWPTFFVTTSSHSGQFCIYAITNWRKTNALGNGWQCSYTNVYTALQRKLVLYRNFSCTFPLQSFFECDFMLTFKTDQGAKILAEVRPMVFRVAKVCPNKTFFQRRWDDSIKLPPEWDVIGKQLNHWRVLFVYSGF